MFCRRYINRSCTSCFDLRRTEFDRIYMNLIALASHAPGNRQRHPCRLPFTPGDPVAVCNPVNPVITCLYTVFSNIQSIEIHISVVVHVYKKPSIPGHLGNIVPDHIHICRYRKCYRPRDAFCYRNMHQNTGTLMLSPVVIMGLGNNVFIIRSDHIPRQVIRRPGKVFPSISWPTICDLFIISQLFIQVIQAVYADTVTARRGNIKIDPLMHRHRN